MSLSLHQMPDMIEDNRQFAVPAIRENSFCGSHLIALTSTSGLPIFSRKRGSNEALSFSTIGSLYGIFTFGKSVNATLENTKTPDGRTVVWKEFADSILLIVCADGIDHENLVQLLEVVFSAMVIRVGLTELKEPKNLERLKREIKNIYPLIDRILDSVHENDKNSHPTDIIGLLECALYEENQVLQAYLETHVENMASMYGSVMLHGRVAVATSSWWTLTSVERLLLALVMQYDTPNVARDLPVFLPDKSPEVPYRLVMSQLMPGVEVCTLCGPAPLITEVEAIVNFTWKNCSDVLKGVVDFKSVPQSVALDEHVVAFLMVNTEDAKYVLCNEPNTKAGSKDNRPPSGHRINILKMFFRRMAPMLLASKNEELQIEGAAEKEAVEVFWSTEFYKCHAVAANANQLFVLFPSAIPRQLGSAIARQSLQTLISEKMFCW